MPEQTARTRAVLLGLAAVAALVAAAMPALPQDPAYHRFADTRALGPVANAANVLSNLLFLFVGVAGLRRAVGNRTLPARAAWIVAFTGIALVSVGSAWYHLAPSDATLVWDRLPMTIGFMGVLAAVLAVPFGERAAGLLLAPAVAAGIASVVVWQLTGDLRFYIWVQFTPLLLIAAMLVLGPLPPAYRRALLAALVLYLLAKGFELADRSLFQATGAEISGHTLKHLAAGASCAALARLTR